MTPWSTRSRSNVWRRRGERTANAWRRACARAPGFDPAPTPVTGSSSRTRIATSTTRNATKTNPNATKTNLNILHHPRRSAASRPVRLDARADASPSSSPGRVFRHSRRFFASSSPRAPPRAFRGGIRGFRARRGSRHLRQLRVSRASPSYRSRGRIVEPLLDGFELALNGVFTLELALRVAHAGARAYFRDPWNRFDVLLVIVGYSGIVADAFASDDAAASGGVRAPRAQSASTPSNHHQVRIPP